MVSWFFIGIPHLWMRCMRADEQDSIPVLTPCFHPLSSHTQDGSCNGLQHYAALGRDLIGAISVNLMPCNVPQDVYSAVAQQVRCDGDMRKRPFGPIGF